MRSIMTENEFCEQSPLDMELKVHKLYPRLGILREKPYS